MSHQNDGQGHNKKQELNQFADELVDFLKDSSSKKAMQEFLMDTFKAFEQKKIEQLAARVENERQVNEKSGAPFHTAGNLAPIMAESLNMSETERAFARGLNQTQKKLQRSVDDRVEEINRLLSGLGGFSSQLKSCFTRSTVVFLEEEDPTHNFRERLIFSINLPNYELKRKWDTTKAAPVEPSLKTGVPIKANKKKEALPEIDADADPRTSLQATWDDAVNSLAQVIATTGLKPKYVKNDRHYGRFVMKQDLRSSNNLPDEYFSFTLDYNTAERINEMQGPYNKIVGEYQKKIEKLEKKIAAYPANSRSERVTSLKNKMFEIVQERDFFVGTTPDPNQLDEGLLFLIEVSTLKDYHIVKDRMQAIMTKYILHLSKLATKEAEVDPDLEYELWKKGQHPEQQALAQGKENVLTEKDIEQLPEYTLDGGKLVPFKKAA